MPSDTATLQESTDQTSRRGQLLRLALGLSLTVGASWLLPPDVATAQAQGGDELAINAALAASADPPRIARSLPHAAQPSIDVVIPAYNEEASLPLVLGALRSTGVRRVVVADNNSRDRTGDVARAGGAEVVLAERQGYGSACLAGLAHLRSTGPPEVVVFIDADYSDHPDELPSLVEPILGERADMVIGSRVLGRRERGALLPQARAGNAVATLLIRLLYGHRFTDMGPFRAVRWSSLERLGMRDPDFGWTAEMQVKALRCGLRVAEVPVSYRHRVGVSKITGTLNGTVRAGYKILSTILLYAWRRP